MKFKRIEKQCPRCTTIKPLTEFVTICGTANPRGKYCGTCHREKHRQHVMELMDGRDFCLYCGVKIEAYSNPSPTCHFDQSNIHCDHMDPVSRGGHDKRGVMNLETGVASDDRRNLVYCCWKCNMAKGTMLFVDWLKTLKPEFQKLAREVYMEKHDGKSPEEFVPSDGIVICEISFPDWPLT